MRTLLFVLFLAPTAALAGPREDVYAASQRCAGLGENRAWLDCYYGAAQPMRQLLNLAPAPAAQTALVPGFSVIPQTAAAPAIFPAAGSPPPATPVQTDSRQTGLFGGTLESNVRLKGYLFGPNGQFILTLANGEIWQQAANDPMRASWNKPAAFYVVAIRQSSRGSVLEIQGDSDSYKVERVR